MNNKVIKILSDSTILFNERMYSKLNLLLNNIRLRNDLEDILTSFNIYKYANKYRNIYDTFMNLGTILRADTFEDISISNAFPDADKLIELERKFADVLNNEDLTGTKKINKNINNYFSNFIYDTIINKTETNNNNNPLIKNVKKSIMKSMKLMPIRKKVHFTEAGEEKSQLNNNNIDKINENINNLKTENKRYLTIDIDNNNNHKINSYTNRINKKNINFNSIDYINEKISKYDKLYLGKTPKVNTRNKIFINILKERENKKNSPYEIFNRNKKYLSKILRNKSMEKFCKPFEGEYDKKKEIIFSPCKKNHYEEILSAMREKYIKDNDHYYTYSEKGLTLSFPMIEGFRNEEYLNYINNKSKWIIPKDFDRYKQPEREKIFFPRINKEI